MSTELNANLSTTANPYSQSERIRITASTNSPVDSTQQNSQVQIQEQRQGETEKLLSSGKELPSQANVQDTALQNKEKDSDDSSVLSAVEDLNNYVQNIGRQLKFNVDGDTGRLVVSVLDSETKELIRQIPSEEVMAIARNLQADGEDKVSLFDAQV